MNTDMSLNAVKFLKQVVEDVKSDIDYACPGPTRHLSENRVHPALQRISSKMEVLEAFIASLEPTKMEVLPHYFPSPEPTKKDEPNGS